MKKTAIITTHAALNHGAVLQAYALNQYIKNTGAICEVINYVPSHVKKSYRLIGSPRNFKDFIRFLYQIVHFSARKTRKKRFESFKNEYLILSGSELKTHKELIKSVNQFDTAILGSDQIWNPDLHDFDEGYFLSFPEITVNRVSYAASFGLDTISLDLEPELRRRLNGISKFACREFSAQKMIMKLTNKSSTFVLDPVFLLEPEHWKNVSHPIKQKTPYILVCFYSNPGNTPALIKQYAIDSNLNILSIGFLPSDIFHGLPHNYSLGPQEFLGAIMSAEYVITNSFHCTAFAIIMKKQFYTQLSHSAVSRNDRMLSLLQALGLEDRMYFGNEVHNLDFSKKINYEKVHEDLRRLKQDSIDYLKSILEI